MKRSFSISFFMIFLAISSASVAQLVVETQDNTSCSGANGSASASVGGLTDGYTFEWYQGSDETGLFFNSGPSVTNLSAGIYTVRAFDQATGQSIGTAQATVSDAITLPEVVTQSIPNTSCSSRSQRLRHRRGEWNNIRLFFRVV